MKRAIAISLLALLFAGCRTSDSLSLLPGQTARISNPNHRTVHIRADYPVSIIEGDCRFPRAVDLQITCAPADIFVTDTRPALLVWARANRVEISAAAF